MSEQTANLCTTDACESLRARLAKYEDAEGRPLQSGVVDERAAFEAWHNQAYGPQDKYNPIRSLAYDSAGVGLGYDDQTVMAQFHAFKGALALSAPSHGEQVRDGWVVTELRRPIEWAEADGTVEVQVSDGSETSTAIFYKKAGAMGWKRLGINNVMYWKPLAAAPSAGSQGGDA